jgi:hypothetical protein
MRDAEAVTSNIFDTKRDRLASRFGHPALYRPLITPMVHAKAQNILASIYGGRLSDSNVPGSGESGSVSGYSDMFALNPMDAGRPGKKAPAVPGFELVPENRLDFAYFKGRAEFGEEHGGGGGIYGKAEDIVRSDTPASSVGFGMDSRPGTPTGLSPRRNFTGQTPISYDAQGDISMEGRNLVYGHRNDSETNLVHEAADMPIATPPHAGHPGSHLRDTSQERRAPGFLGGGPQGYGGLPQHEEDSDPMSYDYYRTRRHDAGWQGWNA